MPPRRAPKTLMEVAYANLKAAGDSQVSATVGASKAILTLFQYAHASQQEGRMLSQGEYVDFWQTSERTGQREWQHFKRAFPTEKSPKRLAQWLVGELPNLEKANPARAGQLRIDSSDLALVA